MTAPTVLHLDDGAAPPAGLDLAALQRQVGGFVRAAHPEPAPLPHEGAPVERVVVAAIRRQRGGVRVALRYFVDRHPNSRYDKSQTAEGWVLLDPGLTRVIRGRLGPLRGPP